MTIADFRSTGSFSYDYKVTLKLATSVSYEVEIPSWLETPTSFNYGYTGVDLTLTGKQPGWRSDHTQVIANGFQDWNRIRNCQDSTGQAIINTFAMGLEEVHNKWRKSQRSLWLETADTHEPWRIYRIGMPSNIDLDKQDSKQILINGGFKNPAVQRYRLPADWTDGWDYSSGSVTMYSGDGIVAGGCVRFLTEIGQRAYIGQTQDVLIPKTEEMTFSIWYKNYEDPSFQTGGTDNSTFMRVSMMYDDGKIETIEKILKQATSGQWERDWLTFSGASDIGKLTVGVELDNLTGSETREYFLDAFQLERGNVATSWAASTVDPPEWLRREREFYSPGFEVECWLDQQTKTGLITGFEATGFTQLKLPLYYISDGEELLERDLPPTRVRWAPETGDVVGISNNIHGFIATSIDDPYEKGWQVVNNNNIQTYMWPNLQDTGGTYKISEPNLNKDAVRSQSARNQFELYHRYSKPVEELQQTGGYGYDLSIEALTIRDDKLWLFGEETWNSETHKVLKLVSTKAELDKDYLELIRDYRLDNLSGTITSAGFIEADPPRVVLSLTGDGLSYSGATVELLYDYFTFDPENRQIYTRDPYTGTNENVVIV